MYNILLDGILLFFIYGFLGWCLEVVYVAIKNRKAENRGFLNGPICPIYGFGMLSVISGNLTLGFLNNNFVLLIVGGIICSAIELIGGWILDKVFHMRWWDYSNRRFNIGGYICLRFSIIWGVGVVFAVRLLHPLVFHLVHNRNVVLKIVAICCFTTVFLIDMVVTLKKLIGIRQSLGQLELVAEELHEVGEQLKDVMGNSAIALADNHLERQKELMEKRDLLIKRLEKHKTVGFRHAPWLNKNGKSIRIEEYVNNIQKKLDSLLKG